MASVKLVMRARLLSRARAAQRLGPVRRAPPRSLLEFVSRFRFRNSNAYDHDFGGFDERGSGLPLFQAHFARGIRRNNGGDTLPSDQKFYLGQQSAVAHFDDPPDQLISPADAAKTA